jgi:hypothetical protein
MEKPDECRYVPPYPEYHIMDCKEEIGTLGIFYTRKTAGDSCFTDRYMYNFNGLQNTLYGKGVSGQLQPYPGNPNGYIREYPCIEFKQHTFVVDCEDGFTIVFKRRAMDIDGFYVQVYHKNVNNGPVFETFFTHMVRETIEG